MGGLGLEFRGVKTLAAFDGVEGAVYAVLGMNKDLSVRGQKKE